VRNDGLANQNDAREVEAHDLIEQLFRELSQLGALDQAACVVDQDVDAAVAESQRFLREAFDLGLFGDVGSAAAASLP
jgi:hypothetical protein